MFVREEGGQGSLVGRASFGRQGQRLMPILLEEICKTIDGFVQLGLMWWRVEPGFVLGILRHVNP